MIRIHHIAWLALLAACGDDPTCEAPRAPQRVAALDGPVTGLRSAWIGGHVYLHVQRPDTVTDVFIGPRCGEAIQVARGTPMFIARIHGDRADDDPSLACDPASGRFFRLDLAGEALPALLSPHLSCATIPTDHGVVVPGHYSAGSPRLWLFAEFPDEASATLLAEPWSASSVQGDSLFFSGTDGIWRRDLPSGATELVADVVAVWDAIETHLLWEEGDSETSGPMILMDVATGERRTVGTFDPAIDIKGDTYLGGPAGWLFAADDEHVLHLPFEPTAAPEAFDLAGEPVPFAVEGVIVHMFDDAALSVGADGRLFHTRIGAPQPTALDHVADPDPLAFINPLLLFQASTLFPGRIEVHRGVEVWAVPLDGGAATRVARDVGETYRWVDPEHLITVVDGALLTIHTPSGERRELASGVEAFAVPDELIRETAIADGIHYIADDSVWYLPPELLVHAAGG
jgi:hypothetical protein